MKFEEGFLRTDGSAGGVGEIQLPTPPARRGSASTPTSVPLGAARLAPILNPNPNLNLNRNLNP